MRVQTPRIVRRGIVLSPPDFSYDWISAAGRSGLNLLALHRVDEVLRLMDTQAGRELVARAIDSGFDVEYELHAMHVLLPRSLFPKCPEWFRLDDRGDRTPDGNFCPSHPDARQTVCENAIHLARTLPPTTHRYFLWQDDGRPWCRCSKCREWTDADQNLIVMNALVTALRKFDPHAWVAYLAYESTLEPPRAAKPADGVFLEWAPIRRCYDHPLDDPACETNRTHRATLEALLDVFDPGQAHVLEYWMDASLFSRYRRPAVRLPFRADVMRRDVAYYMSLGFRSITSFGVYLDRDYVQQYGEPPIEEYGQILAEA